MEALQKRADETEDQVEAMLSGIEKAMKDLEAKKGDLFKMLSGAQDKAEEELEKFATQIEELEAAADKQLEEAEQAVDQFETTVEAVREALEDKKDDLKSEIDSFEKNAKEKVQDLVQEFETATTEGTAKVTELQGALGNLSEQASAAVLTIFTEVVTNALGEAFAPLEQGFHVFEEAKAGCEQLLGGSIGDVADSIKGVTEMIDKIEPVANLIQDMLG